MRRHPRAQAVAHAQSRIRLAITNIWLEEHLTEAEVLQVLTEQASSIAGFMIRHERYPDSAIPDSDSDE